MKVSPIFGLFLAATATLTPAWAGPVLNNFKTVNQDSLLGQASSVKTEATRKLSLGFRTGFLWNCLQKLDYNPQNVGFCLCLLDELVSNTVVESRGLQLPDVSSFEPKCKNKVQQEIPSK